MDNGFIVLLHWEAGSSAPPSDILFNIVLTVNQSLVILVIFWRTIRLYSDKYQFGLTRPGFVLWNNHNYRVLRTLHVAQPGVDLRILTILSEAWVTSGLTLTCNHCLPVCMFDCLYPSLYEYVCLPTEWLECGFFQSLTPNLKVDGSIPQANLDLYRCVKLTASSKASCSHAMSMWCVKGFLSTNSRLMVKTRLKQCIHLCICVRAWAAFASASLINSGVF